MRLLRNILVYFFIPMAIAGLLYLNAQIASDKFGSGTPEVNQYLAEITSPVEAVAAIRGESLTHPVHIRNTGMMAWSPEGARPIVVSYHIYTLAGESVVPEGERTMLPRLIRVGEETSVDLEIAAIDQSGSYILEVDLVHEGVTWFAAQGSNALRLQLDVAETP